jgi:putative peptide zinc metalloprotease protein
MFRDQKFDIRKDLHRSRIRMGSRQLWVVSDPVSGQFFYFDDHEFAILQALDGKRTASAICEIVSRRFAPFVLSQEKLLVFLAELARADLLLGTVAARSDHGAGPTGLATRTTTGWGNPLAIRLGGFEPTKVLDVLFSRIDWVFSKPVLAGMVVLILSAFICGVVRFDDFATSLPSIQEWLTPSLLLTTMLTIGGIKIVHELAHALTARRMGVRCRRMGVLLLFFCPCLYCDVTEAWSLPSRRQRIAISAAGVITELLIAALAYFLWMASNPGPVRTVLAVIITVSTVNSLFVNGNPLLKFDGYYVFSDLVGIPNLSSASSRLLFNTIHKWIWGSNELAPPASDDGPRPLLAAYGLLSWLYRIVLVSVMFWSLYQFGEDWRLASAALLFIGVLLVLLLKPFLTALASPPAGFQFTDQSAWQRPVYSSLGILLILAAAAMLPLPHRIDAPFRIESRQSREVFVTVPGRLVSSIPAGTSVRAGEVIAQLRNHEVDREIQELRISLATLISRKRNLESRRGLVEDADELPALTEQIISTKDRLRLLEQERDQLTIRAPMDGIVVEPPNREAPAIDSRQPEFWNGTPLDFRNRGCFLERGSMLCVLAPAAPPVATLYVTQRRIQKIAVGQPVRLWLPGFPGNRVVAEIQEISPAPVEEIPREILAKKFLPIEDAATATPRPAEPIYQVDARLAPGTPEIPLWMTGNAAIRGRPITLFSALRAMILEAFDL